MKQVVRIDSEGFYVEPVILEDNDKIPSDCIESIPPSLFKARYVDGQWVEGASQEEINAIKNVSVQPSEFSQIKEQNADLNLQIIDIWETLLGSGVIQ